MDGGIGKQMMTERVGRRWMNRQTNGCVDSVTGQDND